MGFPGIRKNGLSFSEFRKRSEDGEPWRTEYHGGDKILNTERPESHSPLLDQGHFKGESYQSLSATA